MRGAPRLGCRDGPWRRWAARQWRLLGRRVAGAVISAPRASTAGVRKAARPGSAATRLTRSVVDRESRTTGPAGDGEFGHRADLPDEHGPQPPPKAPQRTGLADRVPRIRPRTVHNRYQLMRCGPSTLTEHQAKGAINAHSVAATDVVYARRSPRPIRRYVCLPALVSPDPPQRADPGMIPLTVPEAGRLLAHPPPPASVGHWLESGTGWTGGAATRPAPPGTARPRPDRPGQLANNRRVSARMRPAPDSLIRPRQCPVRQAGQARPSCRGHQARPQ